MKKQNLIKRRALDVINSFPKAVAVDLRKLHCESPFGVVHPGERGYQPIWSDKLTLDELDEIVMRQNDTRKPTPAEREAAQIGSMFGWDCPGADPLNCEKEAA